MTRPLESLGGWSVEQQRATRADVCRLIVDVLVAGGVDDRVGFHDALRKTKRLPMPECMRQKVIRDRPLRSISIGPQMTLESLSPEKLEREYCEIAVTNALRFMSHIVDRGTISYQSKFCSVSDGPLEVGLDDRYRAQVPDFSGFVEIRKALFVPMCHANGIPMVPVDLYMDPETDTPSRMWLEVKPNLEPEDQMAFDIAMARGDMARVTELLERSRGARW